MRVGNSTIIRRKLRKITYELASSAEKSREIAKMESNSETVALVSLARYVGALTDFLVAVVNAALDKTQETDLNIPGVNGVLREWGLSEIEEGKDYD